MTSEFKDKIFGCVLGGMLALLVISAVIEIIQHTAGFR